jgi:nicotinamidase-related amidase
MASGIRHGGIGGDWLHLCVDMQNLFAPGGPWQVDWFQSVLPLIVSMVEAGPERTVFTRFIPPLEAHAAQGTWQRYYSAWPQITRRNLPSNFLELAPPLQKFVPPGRMIDKPVYSPWLGSELDLLLRSAGVNTLIITGGETDMCVLATVLGAVDRGYRCILVSDGICSSTDRTHDAVMSLYRDRFKHQIEIAELDEVVAAL